MTEEPLIFVPDARDFYSFELTDLANATTDDFQAMVALNQATSNWTSGTIDTAEYTDVLSWYDINPDEHLQDIDWFMRQLERTRSK